MALVEDHDEGPPSKRTRKYCCHCSEYVGYSTYYRHRERFFDPVSNQWTVDCGASEVGASSDSDTETSQNEIDSNEVQFNFQGFNGRNEGTGRCILLYQGATRPL